GAKVWGPIALPGHSDPVYDGGSVFVLNWTVPTGTLLAYDGATGQLRWSTVLSGSYEFTAPSAANGFVDVSGFGNTGATYAINEGDGSIAWTRSAGNMSSVPAVTNDGVFVHACATTDLRPASGDTIWQEELGLCALGGSMTVAAHGKVYIPTDNLLTW